MRVHLTLALAFVFIALAGCSRFSEGDKLFIDVTEGGIDQAAYIEATVLEETGGQLSVHIDTLHCEAGCGNLSGERMAAYRGSDQAIFTVDEVQPWEAGKAAYDKRIGAYRALVEQARQRGALFRVEPSLLTSTRLIMQQEGFADVLTVFDLAEFEQRFFTDNGAGMSLREVIEAYPAFLGALRERLEEKEYYEAVRRLRTEADLITLINHPDRLYLTALYRELASLQGLYLDYLLPKEGDDQKAMELHFRYVDAELVDSAGRALADFYSDDCQYLPAGQECSEYRASFKKRAMHRLVSRLKDNLAKVIADKSLATEQERVSESMSLFRFVLNASGRFPEQSPLLSQGEIDRMVR
jgi:hypothetical protein